MAKPDVTLSVEPMQDKSVTYLVLAPTTKNDEAKAQISLLVRVRKNETSKIVLETVRLMVNFPNHPLFETTFPVSMRIDPGQTGIWHNKVFTAKKADHPKLPHDVFINQNVVTFPNPNILTVRLTFRDFEDPVNKMFALRPHQSPTAQKAYIFPAKTKDLRIGEYWSGAAAVHGDSEHGCQLFALDVGVTGWDKKAQAWSNLLPEDQRDPKKNQNSDHRIWKKPVYAMSDGEVIKVRWDFPNNPEPGDPDKVPQRILDLRKKVGDGGGNLLHIAAGDEVYSYGHLHPDTIPEKLRHTGVQVKKGEFLGLVGNSGYSWGPHLHFGVIKRLRVVTPGQVVKLILRPMPFTDMFSIHASKSKGVDLDAPWFKHTNHGLSLASPEGCLIWPSAKKPTLYPPGMPEVLHFGVSLKDYPDLLKKTRDSGYRLVWIDGYTVKGRPHFNAIFRPTGGIQTVPFHHMRSTEYQKLFNQCSKDGFRLTHIETYWDDGIWYAGVFEKSPGPVWAAYHDKGAEEHDKLLADLGKDGFVPFIVSRTHTVFGKHNVAALYYKVSIGSVDVKSNMSHTAFLAQHKAHKEAGKELVYLHSFNDSHGPKFSGVWHGGANHTQRTAFKKSDADMQRELEAAWADGYLTKCITGIASKGQRLYSALWTK
jgi:hypothetical protein